MRRKDREITSLPEIREIVNSATECHLALNDNGTPYGITLNYGFEEENGIFTLYFHGAGEGRKAEIIRRNPDAYFFMESGCRFHEAKTPDGQVYMTMFYSSAEGAGSICEIADPEEKRHALACLTSRFSPTPVSVFPEAVIRKTAIWKMTIPHMTAKQNAPRK